MGVFVAAFDRLFAKLYHGILKGYKSNGVYKVENGVNHRNADHGNGVGKNVRRKGHGNIHQNDTYYSADGIGVDVHGNHPFCVAAGSDAGKQRRHAGSDVGAEHERNCDLIGYGRAGCGGGKGHCLNNGYGGGRRLNNAGKHC